MARYHSLRTKLITAFALLALGPLVAMGILASYVVKVTHRQDVATMQTQLLVQKSAEINRFVDDTAGLFDIRVGYDQTSAISERDQNFLLEKLVGENKSVLEVSFVDMRGKETAKYSQTQDSQLSEMSDLSELPEFKAAAEGKKYFGPIQLTAAGPTMVLSGPVLNRRGQVVMVIAGTVKLDYLQRIISSSALGSSSYFYVVDKQGTVVASTMRQYLGKNVSANDWIKRLLSGERRSGLDAGDERFGIAGEIVLSAGMPLSKVGLALVTEWPKADAFVVVQSIQNQILGFAGAAIAIVVFLGWMVGRKILRPLSQLREGAHKIGSGNFEYKLDIKTEDEIEDLGEVLNAMGSSLKRLEELKAAEIREKALAESLAKEKAVSRMKEEFINNTSHQLRTPLSIARWNYDLMVKASTLEEEKELKQSLGAGLRQLNMIVRDLIAVSSFGFGYKNTDVNMVDMAELAAQSVEGFRKSIEEKQIQWNTKIAPGIPKVPGNIDGFKTLLDNLIENAVTYTRAGGAVNFTLTASAECLTLAVSDNGIGIPEEDKKLLFTQFFRAKNAIDMKNVGTGLGLFLCKNIAEGHGGTIVLESELGKGTAVDVNIPLSGTRETLA